MKQQTQNSYYRRISRVVAQILADPSASHTLESLAAVAHLSPFHFHRIYRALTGEGVAETVRRVRLAHAARHLSRGVGSITGISLDAGYESPQAFARAFRDFTGVSPSDYQARHRGPALASMIKYVEIAPTRMLCLRHEGPPESIGLTHRKLFTLLAERINLSDQPLRVGICVGDPSAPDFVYRAGLAHDSLAEPVAGLETLQLEGGLYASHRLIGPHGLIAPTFEALFGEWLPQSGFEPDHRPALEFYRRRRDHGEKDEHFTDLMIPIREI